MTRTARKDDRTMAELVEAYLRWLEVNRFARLTVRQRKSQMKRFATWCDERAIVRARDVSRTVVEQYQRALFHHRRANGQPLSRRTQTGLLGAVSVFFGWLTKQELIERDPTAAIELPRVDRTIPRNVLSEAEIGQVLDSVDVSTPLGIRDRAILETFYSTGIRRAELGGLQIRDLDVERGTLFVQNGKGGRDRMVPIGERAIAWIEKYLVEVRPEHEASECGALFLGVRGRPLSTGRITQLVVERMQETGVASAGCHVWRHSVATLMLNNGAGIRYIQQLLGHADLSTTQIYTQVSIQELKEVHTRTHPARLFPKKRRDGS